MVKKIQISYFPTGLKIVSPLIFGSAIYLITLRHSVWGILLILTGIIILTTKYITEIDLKEKRYRDYLFFLGLNLNEDSNNFNAIDRIVVTRGNYSQTINTRSRSRQMDWSDYTGTLILDNGTLNLLTRNDKKELIRGLREFSDFLEVGIEDRTTHQHYWIDIKNIQ